MYTGYDSLSDSHFKHTLRLKIVMTIVGRSQYIHNSNKLQMPFHMARTALSSWNKYRAIHPWLESLNGLVSL